MRFLVVWETASHRTKANDPPEGVLVENGTHPVPNQSKMTRLFRWTGVWVLCMLFQTSRLFKRSVLFKKKSQKFLEPR